MLFLTLILMLKILLILGGFVAALVVLFLIFFNVRVVKYPESSNGKPVILEEVVNEESFNEKVKEAIQKGTLQDSSESGRLSSECMGRDKEVCEEKENCRWFSEFNSCYSNCDYIKDKNLCESHPNECIWLESISYPGTGTCFVK